MISLLKEVLSAMRLFSQGHKCVYNVSGKENSVCNLIVLTRAYICVYDRSVEGCTVCKWIVPTRAYMYA